MENDKLMENVKSKMTSAKRPKVAIVCDWLTGTGGAERVVLELHRLYPDAPIYTSQYDRNPKIWYGDKWFAEADVRTGWLQKLPKSLKKFLPVLRAWYFSRLNLNDYDLVISSSGAEAKFVKTKGKHITYCHSPTHYYWQRYDEYLKKPGFGFFDPLAKIGLRLLAGPMRQWDHHAAQRPDFFVANSKHTREQIKKYYGREAVVIHPPVDIERFIKHSQPAEQRHGLVTAGRQTPYKNIDLVIEAVRDEALVVIGNGPDHGKLEKLAERNVTFLTKVSDSQMAEQFGGAKAFILPNSDDFGIVAVEALAAGTPVIAYKAGGALDYVNSDSGIFFDEPNTKSLLQAITKLNQRNFDHAKIQAVAKQFSAQNFRKGMQAFINKVAK